MENATTQSPNTVERSDTEDTIKLPPGVTRVQHGQDDDNDPVGRLGNAENVEDIVGHQEGNKTSADDLATCDTGEGYHPGQHAGKISCEHTMRIQTDARSAADKTIAAGQHASSQKQADDAQGLTGETAYHWLKDITARVTSIEGRLVEEDEHSDTASTVSTDDDNSHIFETKPVVKDCHWEEFKNRFSTDTKTVPVIETLLRSADTDAEIHEEQLKRQSQEPGSQSAYQEPFNPSSKSPSLAPDDTYDRIRINSTFILAFLSKVAHDVSWKNPLLQSLTFLRPFKFLVYFHEQMEKELSWLEEKFGSTASADQTLELETQRPTVITTQEVPVDEHQPVNEDLIEKSASQSEVAVNTVKDAPAGSHIHQSEQKDQDNTASSTALNESKGMAKAHQTLREVRETGSYEAYMHMKCYVDFVRTRLIPRHRKFDIADYGKPPQVYHSDLCVLFRVGELVLQQDAIYQRDTDKSGDSQMESDNPRSDAKGPRLWRVIRISTPSPAWAVVDPGLAGEVRKWSTSKGDAKPFIRISVYYVDFDGESYYSSKPINFTIPFFAGERDITSLPIYPVRFAKGYEQTLKQLQKRGEKFQSIVSQAHPLQTYEGWTLIRDPSGKAIEDAHGDRLKFPEHIDGDVIIDFGEALLIHPWWKPEIGQFIKDTPNHVREKDPFPINLWADRERSKLLGRTWDWTYTEADAVATMEYNRFMATNKSIISRNHEMTDDIRKSAILELLPEDLVLLPSRIFVYALRERKFVNADIQYLRQSSVMENPFESLEIAEEHKDLITSTVFEHFEKKGVRRDAQRQGLEISDQDFIRGKGRGLIILLHGAPGVGKTATAEACSYAHNKPLFPITCGDLGIEPQKVEETLSELFRLANLWDCILLFDEADIFLSTREKKDDNLQRNALVSIFLRTLEYYSGVLFLTTNRAGVLDEAVKSRVHISLYYPYLGLRETKALFQMNIDRLRNIEAERARITGKPLMAIEEKRILKFAEDHYMRFEKEYDKRWNGRQIRNAFQIAASLARHQYHRHCLEGNSHRGLYMTSDHFQTVENATNKYDEYRQQLFEKTDVEIAKEREERHHPS